MGKCAMRVLHRQKVHRQRGVHRKSRESMRKCRMRWLTCHNREGMGMSRMRTLACKKH
mgnify:CR=1 FL=1